MSEHVEHGFGPVWDGESRVLILGSMPSPKSRASAFYYMHPQNRFWPVMQALFANSADPTDAVGDLPESRRAFALRHHIALWDVIASCDITGASDASIRNAEPNDLAPILRGAPIAHIFTTGAKSAQLYRKLIEPRLTEACIAIGMTLSPPIAKLFKRQTYQRMRIGKTRSMAKPSISDGKPSITNPTLHLIGNSNTARPRNTSLHTDTSQIRNSDVLPLTINRSGVLAVGPGIFCQIISRRQSPRLARTII